MELSKELQEFVNKKHIKVGTPYWDPYAQGTDENGAIVEDIQHLKDTCDKYDKFIANGHIEDELFNDKPIYDAFVKYVNKKYDQHFQSIDEVEDFEDLSDESEDEPYLAGYCGSVSDSGEGYSSPIERINGGYYTEWEGDLSDYDILDKITDPEYFIHTIKLPYGISAKVDDPYKKMNEINKADELAKANTSVEPSEE